MTDCLSLIDQAKPCLSASKCRVTVGHRCGAASAISAHGSATNVSMSALRACVRMARECPQMSPDASQKTIGA